MVITDGTSVDGVYVLQWRENMQKRLFVVENSINVMQLVRGCI